MRADLRGVLLGPVKGCERQVRLEAAIACLERLRRLEPDDAVVKLSLAEAQLDATRIGRNAGRIAEEVVQDLAGLVGANVEVTLEIRADVPVSVPEWIMRIVSENCRALKFKTYEFEEE